jgi:F0F1-type ATP synthase assembly protein I
VIIIIEAIVLWLMNWNDFWSSLLGSLFANLASLIVGLFLTDELEWKRGMTLLDPEFIVVILSSLLISVVIEGVVLSLINRGIDRKSTIAVITANFSSYIWNAIVMAIILVL